MSSHPHFLWKDLFQTDTHDKNLSSILQNTALFKTLTPRELSYLSSIVYERIYQPHETVFQQNDRGIGMYIVAQGRVAVKSQSPSGDILITILGQGSFFGEIALVDPENLRSATVESIERSTLIGFFKPDLLAIMQSKPEMSVKILLQLSTILGRRLMETTDKLSELASKVRESA